MTQKKFYYIEWHEAEKEGNKQYACDCKEIYRQLVMASLKKPYNLYIEKLKQYPMIYLN